MRSSRGRRCIAGLALLAGVVSVGFAPATQAAAPAAYGAVLRVDDTQAVGTLGDQFLSLDEAIRLANGSLKLSMLSSAERAQVTGNLGPGRADLIKVVLPAGSVITSPSSAPFTSAISVIKGATGDTLDGGGSTLSTNGVSGVGLIVSSSHFVLENLTVSGFQDQVDVDPLGRALRDVTIRHMRLLAAPLTVLKVASSRSLGSLTGLRISNNYFEGGSAQGVVTLAASNATATTANHTRLQDVVFDHNEVVGGNEALYVEGALVAEGSVQDAVTRNVTVRDNDFHGAADASLSAAGTEGLGVATNSGVDRLTIVDNRVVANAFGIGLWGSEAYGDGASRYNYIRHVTIAHNDVSGLAGNRLACIDLEAGRSTFESVSESNDLTDIAITDNRLANCFTGGISMMSGDGIPGLVTRDNLLSHVFIARNDIQDSPTGVALRAGFVAPSATALNNVIRDISVEENRLTSNTVGILMIGGDATFTTSAVEVETGAPPPVDLGGGIARGNTISRIAFIRNVIAGGTHCVIIANAGLTAVGNSVDAQCPV